MAAVFIGVVFLGVAGASLWSIFADLNAKPVRGW